MNKSRLIVALSLTLILPVCSCKKGNTTKATSEESAVTEVNSGTTKSGDTSNVKKVAIPVMSDFYSITSIGSIDVVYTQGEKASIDVEGDSSLLALVNANIDSGVLTISLESQANPNLSHYEGKYGVTAYVSSPELHIVALCRTGNFRSLGKWVTEHDVDFAAYDTGTFDVEDLKCKNFRMESHGKDNSNFGMITSDLVYFFFRGPSKYHVGVNTPSLAADLASGTVFEVTGHADYHSIKGTGAGTFVNKMR